MIIPIGHEEDSVSRLPWVTFGIMILCFFAFVATDMAQRNFDEAEVMERALPAIEYYFEHPYLELPPQAEQLLYGADQDALAMMQEMYGFYPEEMPDDTEEIADQQRHLDRLCDRMMSAIGANPYLRFGLVPAEMRPHTLITHMFMHGGLLHLIGNLLILYLAGPFIEDKWGRPLFAAFYVAAGLGAALIYIAFNRGSPIPMIGASGAIAGVMGAFLVRYRSTKIKFFYIFGFFWRGTFDAPAWVMLPMWFGEQLFLAMLTSSTGIMGGVAYWAHVGGFGLGALGAWSIKHWRVEERIHPKLVAATTATIVDNPEVERALAAAEAGNPDQAVTMLAEAWRHDRANAELGLALWGVASEHERAAEAEPAMLAVIQDEIRRGLHELALNHWNELVYRVPEPRAGADLLIRVAQLQQQARHPQDASATLRRALLAAGASPPATTALRIARLARTLDPTIARGAARLALAQPDLDPQVRQQAEALLG